MILSEAQANQSNQVVNTNIPADQDIDIRKAKH